MVAEIRLGPTILITEHRRESAMKLKGLISTLLVSAAMLAGATLARADDDVTVQLDWVVRGNHAMFFVAKDKGYFKQNGINVTAIRKGTGTPDALRLVANGNADFGFGDLPTLAISRSQGVPVVAIAAVNQASPLAMISIAKTKQLNSPADLKGLNIGIHPAGSTYVFFKALLAANGMSEKDVLLAQLQADIDSTFNSDDTKAGGLGTMTDKKWQSTLDVLKDQGVLKAPVDVKDVYSDAFLAK
jgi:ABC-type nitrate/sulfonate/bicarbonate transport system substrate-binding protein